MSRAMKRWTVVGSLFFSGCFTPPVKRQFLPIGLPHEAAAKQPSDVQIFADPSQVPFPYVEMGRITEESQPNHHQSSGDQISAIRALAAANGADAVIVSKQILMKGGTYHSPEEGVVHRAEVALFSGIAIEKSTSTPTAAMPVEPRSEVVSIADLFAVPEKYLNKTVLVEGIYSQLTVGSQSTGFTLASSVNNQLELVCAYRNTELDEFSRRSLMNSANRAPLQVEGRLIHSSEGAAKDAGLGSRSGYELSVTRIVQ
jgi:hypothetical protein